MAESDSSWSHASCESADGNDDENVDVLVKRLDVNVLMASLLEEKCVSMEQDDARGKKLCADVCAYLGNNEFWTSRSYTDENLLLKQKEILNKIIRSMAQNATEEDILQLSGQSAVQNSRYKNEFKEIKRLGKGGFGTVFEAKHNLDGRNYAVKRISLKKDEDMTKPLREVRALARLKHENIMGYHTAWFEDDSRVSTSAGSSYDDSEGSSESMSNKVVNLGQEHDKVPQCQPAKKEKKTLCIQMELCNCTLQEWLQQRNEKLQNTSIDYDTDDLPPDVKHIFHEIVSGVSFIHSRGLMHRDLKPQNIFLCGQGLHVKIGDFGLVKGVCGSDSVLSSPTVEGVSIDFNANTPGIGTKLYGSPELLRGETCDTKCDMYSLGVILFELCNTFTTEMERFEIITKLRKTNHCPGQLERLWSEKVQLIEDLISPVPACRPTAQNVLEHPLFATATQDQTLWKLNMPVHTQDQKFETQHQKVQKHGQKVQKPDRTFQKQDHKLKKPDQTFEKQDHKLKKPDQTFEKQDRKLKKPDQTFEKQDHKLKKPDQAFEKQDHKLKKPDQTFEKQDHKLKKPDQAFEKQDHKLNRQDQAFEKQDHKLKKPDQAFEKQDHKLKKPDQAFEKQDHKLKKPDQAFEKQDHKLKKPDQAFEKQDHKLKKPDHKFKKQDHKFKKPDQTFQEQGQQSEEQDHKFMEHALNSSREANPDIGFTPKNKK